MRKKKRMHEGEPQWLSSHHNSMPASSCGEHEQTDKWFARGVTLFALTSPSGASIVQS
jgi:hypothetical protein